MYKFPKSSPRGLECKVIFNVIMEWTVLKPVRISAVLILPKKLLPTVNLGPRLAPIVPPVIWV